FSRHSVLRDLHSFPTRRSSDLERQQIFEAYLSLNKYCVENLQEGHLRELLIKHGVDKKDLEKDGRKLGTLKLLTLFMQRVLKIRSEEHTSELQSRENLVCRLLL